MNPPEPGWYRDPYFKNRERYWDGEVWSDECRLIQPALSSGTGDGASGTTGRRSARGPARSGYGPAACGPQGSHHDAAAGDAAAV